MSVTISGIAVFLIGKFLGWTGFSVGNEQITTFVEVLVQIVGGIIVWWGRFRQGDIKWYGAKK